MKIKSLFISDLHLGNPNCQADKVLEVLKSYEFENLFIIGDFIDMTYLKRKYYWHPDHSTVIQKVLRLSRKGGNEYIHKTVSGESIYIVHGDCFDGFIRMHPFLYWLGDKSYEFSITINNLYNKIRKMCNLEYWSLSAYLKTRVKNIVKFLSEYKKMSEEKVKEMKCDSIMMGHTHTPQIINGEYYNTGDFCETCSYVIENMDGTMELKFVL